MRHKHKSSLCTKSETDLRALSSQGRARGSAEMYTAADCKTVQRPLTASCSAFSKN